MKSLLVCILFLVGSVCYGQIGNFQRIFSDTASARDYRFKQLPNYSIYNGITNITTSGYDLTTPPGTTDERPTVPAGKYILRYNTDSSALEIGNPSQVWRTLGMSSIQTFDTSSIANFGLKVKGTLSSTTPLLYNGVTGNIAIQQSNSAQAGYLSQADWIAFNAKLPSPGANGLVAKTADGFVAARQLVASSNNVSIVNANGISGNPSIDLNDTLDLKQLTLHSIASDLTEADSALVLNRTTGNLEVRALPPPGSVKNAIGTGDTLATTNQLKRLNPGYGVIHDVTATVINQSIDTLSANGLVTKYQLSQSSVSPKNRYSITKQVNDSLQLVNDLSVTPEAGRVYSYGFDSTGIRNFTENKYIIGKTLNELRSLRIVDTARVYRVVTGKQVRDFYYDPSDNTSVDDTASILVTTGGKRLKRYFGGVYRPEDFGAKGDGVTNDAPAWQKMLNWINASGTGGQVSMDAKANYRFDTVVTIPKLTAGKILVIDGHGGRITGNKIFIRRPPSDVLQTQWVNVQVVIRNCEMRRTGTQTGSVAIDLGATYNCMIEGNYILDFDTAVVVRFCLNGNSFNNQMIGVNAGLVVTYGAPWGGGIDDSQSNGFISRGDRVYGDAEFTGSAAFSFYAVSDCQLKNFIAEGFDMNYAVIFDDFTATVTKGFSVQGGHIEFLNGPDSAAFYIRQNGGQVNISDIYIQVCDTLIRAENYAITHMNIENWGHLPVNAKFINKGVITNYWTFSGMYYSFNPKNFMLTSAGTGGAATDPAKLAAYSASGIIAGTNKYDIFDTLSRGLSIQSGDVRIYGSDILWETTNTYDVGGSATGNAPRYVNAQTGFVTNGTDGTYRWGTGNGIGFGPVSGDDQVIRMIRGVGVGSGPTGSLGIPYGTTAQRTASGINGLLRVNSDSTATEWKISSVWHTAASRAWVRSQGYLTSLGTVGVSNGGTGNTSLTPYTLLAGGTTSTGPLQQVSGTGTTGQVLTSNGAGALPTWQDAAGGGGSGTVTLFTFTDGGGFTGNVLDPSTTPTLSLIPSFTGLAYSDGLTLDAATVGNLLEYGSGTLQFNDAYMASLPNNHIWLKSRMKRLSYAVPDADFTTLISRQEALFELPDITANRSFDMYTDSGIDGEEIYIYNGNTSGTFSWSFTGNAPKKSSDGSTVTTMTNGVLYHIMGTYVNSTATWVIINQ